MLIKYHYDSIIMEGIVESAGFYEWSIIFWCQKGGSPFGEELG